MSMESRKTIGVFSEKNDGAFSNTGAMKKTSCLLVLLLKKGVHFFLSQRSPTIAPKLDPLNAKWGPPLFYRGF